MLHIFLFPARPALVHGVNFSAWPTRVGKKIKECHMENSTHCYIFLYINQERSEKIKYFIIYNKLLSSLKLTIYLLVIVLAMFSSILAWN